MFVPGIYANSNQLRLAIDRTSDQEFLSFLKNKGFTSLQYSGKYSDLLEEDLVDPGTMASPSLATAQQPTNLRINGTFLHSPPLLVHAISQFYM